MTNRPERINSEVEKLILTGMIVSSPFLREIQPIVREEFFQNKFIRRVVGWVQEYYTQFKEAPGRHIEDIFIAKQEKLQESESKLISEFLSRLSTEFEQENPINKEYLFSETQRYFSWRALDILSAKLAEAKAKGKLQEAILATREVQDLTVKVEQTMDPSTRVEVLNVYEKKLEEEDFRESALFSFPGALGEMIGSVERGWLIGILGPMKRGKTWWLQEFLLQTAFNKWNSIMYSLEMSKEGLLSRVYKRITGMAEPKYKNTTFLFPCFDCIKNQNGSCPDRISRVKLVNGGKPRYEEAPAGYIPCVRCRGTNQFEIETWFEPVEIQKMELNSLVKYLQGFNGLCCSTGARYRVHAYPTFSASIDDIITHLDILKYRDGFTPDTIVIDYMDILLQKHTKERLDEDWKLAKGLAEERNCLVVVGTQAQRETLEKHNVKASNTGWDIRKLAHVDVMLSLNQIEQEKKDKVIRVGVASHRWQDFQELRQVMVLQQLELGQVCLDSEWI